MGITCASDCMSHPEIDTPIFYDIWVARDKSTVLENAPLFTADSRAGVSVSTTSAHSGPIMLEWDRIALFLMSDFACLALSTTFDDFWKAGCGAVIRMIAEYTLLRPCTGLQCAEHREVHPIIPAIRQAGIKDCMCGDRWVPFRKPSAVRNVCPSHPTSDPASPTNTVLVSKARTTAPHQTWKHGEKLQHKYILGYPRAV